MLKKRMLALLLSLAMMLTFMPAMAYANDEIDDASNQPATGEFVEEEIAEEPEGAEKEKETFVEEAVEEVADSAETEEESIVKEPEMNGEVYPESATFDFSKSGKLKGFIGDNDIFKDGFHVAGNKINVRFNDGKETTYEYLTDYENGIWGFYLNGDTTTPVVYFSHRVMGNGRLKAGDNNVMITMEYHDQEYDLSSVIVEGVANTEITSVEYNQADTVKAVIDSSGWAEYFGDGEKGEYYKEFAGDTLTVKKYEFTYDGHYNLIEKKGPYTVTYECKKVNDSRGESLYDFVVKQTDNTDFFGNVGESIYKSFNLNFWDDQRDDNLWKAGTKHELTVSVDGVEPSQKLKVDVTASPKPHAHISGNIEKVVVTDATCTKPGSYDEITYCKECGQEMSRFRKTSEALGHSINLVESKPATCQAAGIKKHYECSECHKMFTDANGSKELTSKQIKKLIIKKKKHSFKKKSGEYLKSAATCTKPAVYYYTCKMCGQKGKKTYKSGKKLGHDFVPGNITKATAKKDGKIASKCSRCAKTNKGVKIPKASKVISLNKKSVVYIGDGKEKDAISLRIKAGKYPISSEELNVVYGNPVYGKKGKGSGTVTVNFKPECKYYKGTLKLTYKITKVPKN